MVELLLHGINLAEYPTRECLLKVVVFLNGLNAMLIGII